MMQVVSRDFWLNALGGVSAAVVLAGAVALLVLAVRDSPSDIRARAVCDVQVERLLNSTDLVEVTRAGILVRKLDCSVRRRLP
jgi:hypothetical protein